MNDIMNMMEEDFEKTLSSVETLDNAGLHCGWSSEKDQAATR